MKKTKAKYLAYLLLVCLFGCVLGLAACGDSTVSVTFYNGDEAVATVSGKAGDEIGSIPLPAKTGYMFAGWANKQGEAFSSSVLPSKSTEVYAQFTPNAYHVTFHAGNGTGVAVTVDAAYDQTVEVPASALNFKRAGFTLTGWTTSQKADAADFSLETDIRNLTTAKDMTITLYAYYTPNAVEQDFVVENGTVYAYIGSSSVISLPNSATRIAEYAFRNNTFTDVVVPATYEEIGFGAFAGCENLQRLTVPFIGGSSDGNAFLAYVFGAATYKDNTFSYRVVDGEMDESTLSGTFFIPRSLRVVTVNNDIDTIPEGAFYYAFGLEKVIVYPYADANAETSSYHVKTVEESAFEGCHRIGYDSVTDTAYCMQWLSGVETFAKRSFYGYISANSMYASSLQTLGTLSAVKTVEEEAFANNSTIYELHLGENLRSIGNSAFSSLNLLQCLEIPDSCQSIGDSAFAQCLYLTSVTIGSGVQSIGDLAFAYSTALTEVFFTGDSLPTIGADAFDGLLFTDAGLPELLDTCNDGLVLYFADATAKEAAQAYFGDAYPTAKTAIAGQASKTYYYVENDTFALTMHFSGGHTVVIDDRYGRSGFGLPVIVGTYSKETQNIVYGEIYSVSLLLSQEIAIHLNHVYVNRDENTYRIDTFTLVQPSETTYTVGNKNSGYYLEENKWGQIGLWHNGTRATLHANAVGTAGEITQTYSDGTPRAFAYYELDAYGEIIAGTTREFIYTPVSTDTENTLNGTLEEVTNATDYVFGSYTTADGMVQISIDEKTKNLEIVRNGYVILNAVWDTTDGDRFVKTSDSVTVEYGNTTVTFTDPMENVTDGNFARNVYARATFRYESDSATYHLYNRLFHSVRLEYKVDGDDLIDDYYIFVRYEQTQKENQDEQIGFGEHVYMNGGRRIFEYFGYTYGNEQYSVVPDNGNAYTTALEEYVPYYSQEAGVTLTHDKTQITLSGYGRATYVDERNEVKRGSYGLASDNPVPVAQVFADASSYYYLYEYVFRSDDGSVVQYFAPCFYDAYDESIHAGDMLFPDEMKGKELRIYNAEKKCTGVFIASGYGMGTLRILCDPDGNVTDEPIAETTVLYTQLDTVDGKPLYCMYNNFRQGYFTFTATARGIVPHAEYDDWWRLPTALYVTGDMSPDFDAAEKVSA